MRSHEHVPRSQPDRANDSAPLRRGIGICAIVAAALVAYSIMLQRSDAGLPMNGQLLASSCIQWHQIASAAVSRTVQSTRDVDLRRAGDAIFRLRRARRNCMEGWLGLACHDYYAVVSNAPEPASDEQKSLIACQPGAGSPAIEARGGAK